MSRIKQLVPSAEPEDRNSSADEKARAAKPNSSIRSGSDSRMELSSSTTDRRRGSPPLLSLRDFITKLSAFNERRSIVLWVLPAQELAFPHFPSSAALAENKDVRLSSRKVACSSVAPTRSTGNSGSACVAVHGLSFGCWKRWDANPRRSEQCITRLIALIRMKTESVSPPL
jgi:hypothetical protein